MQTLTLFAPAKLNRFLHIVGRRADGYHQLQTIFHLIDYGDTLRFTLRQDHQINLVVRKGDVNFTNQISTLTDKYQLIIGAAHVLQQSTLKPVGVDIELIKRIPLGSGLGGGSSNAATTLLALNQLWQLKLPITVLAQLGQQLGADVPCFVHGCSAWGEGIGEQLTALTLPETWFLVLVPPIQVPTIEIFCDEQLTRNTPRCKMSLSLLESGHNDCEAVVRRLYPEVGQVLDWLGQFTTSRMTGTGCCVFAAFSNEDSAHTIAKQVPTAWGYFVARGLSTV